MDLLIALNFPEEYRSLEEVQAVRGNHSVIASHKDGLFKQPDVVLTKGKVQLSNSLIPKRQTQL